MTLALAASSDDSLRSAIQPAVIPGTVRLPDALITACSSLVFKTGLFRARQRAATVGAGRTGKPPAPRLEARRPLPRRLGA